MNCSTWDAQQQLATVTTGSNITSYIYDAAGDLLLRKGPNGSTLYLAGQELTAVGTVVTPTRYYSIGDSTAAQRVGGSGDGTLTWLTGDTQGSAQLAIDPTTGATTQQLYMPFGAQRGSQGPVAGSQRTFLGNNYDPGTQLLQDDARMYDPTLKRFISPDPIATPYQPQNLNAYSYAVNNPTSVSDPSGLDAVATLRHNDAVHMVQQYLNATLVSKYGGEVRTDISLVGGSIKINRRTKEPYETGEPDLVWISSDQSLIMIWEVKHVNAKTEASGIPQLDKYLEKMREEYPGARVVPGATIPQLSQPDLYDANTTL